MDALRHLGWTNTVDHQHGNMDCTNWGQGSASLIPLTSTQLHLELTNVEVSLHAEDTDLCSQSVFEVFFCKKLMLLCSGPKKSRIILLSSTSPISRLCDDLGCPLSLVKLIYIHVMAALIDFRGDICCLQIFFRDVHKYSTAFWADYKDNGCGRRVYSSWTVLSVGISCREFLKQKWRWSCFAVHLKIYLQEEWDKNTWNIIPELWEGMETSGKHLPDFYRVCCKYKTQNWLYFKK